MNETDDKCQKWLTVGFICLCVCVCVSVSLSVTRRYYIDRAEYSVHKVSLDFYTVLKEIMVCPNIIIVLRSGTLYETLDSENSATIRPLSTCDVNKRQPSVCY